jgi:hypothetical protein
VKKLFLFIAFVFSTFSVQAQKFEFPNVRNTVPAIENALLRNTVYLSEKSTMVDHVRYEDTNKRYIEHIDFVLTNMTYKKNNELFSSGFRKHREVRLSKPFKKAAGRF